MTEQSEIRDRALRAMLPIAAGQGWNWATIRAGLAAIGEDPALAESHFPTGPVGAVAHSRADRLAMGDVPVERTATALLGRNSARSTDDPRCARTMRRAPGRGPPMSSSGRASRV